MKITKLEIHILRAPDTGRPHWVSNFIVPRANEILVRMHTDEGIVGLGETFYGPAAAEAHIHQVIAPYLIGKDPRNIELINCHLRTVTVQSRGGINRQAVADGLARGGPEARNSRTSAGLSHGGKSASAALMTPRTAANQHWIPAWRYRKFRASLS